MVAIQVYDLNKKQARAGGDALRSAESAVAVVPTGRLVSKPLSKAPQPEPLEDITPAEQYARAIRKRDALV